jgi:hypothetical protein
MGPRLAIACDEEAESDRCVNDQQPCAFPAARMAVPDDPDGHADGPRHRRHLFPAERQRQRVREEEGEEHHRGRHEQRDLRTRRDGDLAGELHLAGPRDHDRAAVLGGVADDRDDHRGDEELTRSDRVCERVERVHEDLADDRGQRGCRAERHEGAREGPRTLRRDVAFLRPMAAQVPERDREVERQQDDGERDRGDDGGVPLGRARVAEHDRRQHDGDRGRAEPELRQERAPVDLDAVRPDDLGDAEDEQEVRDDRARE